MLTPVDGLIPVMSLDHDSKEAEILLPVADARHPEPGGKDISWVSLPLKAGWLEKMLLVVLQELSDDQLNDYLAGLLAVGLLHAEPDLHGLVERLAAVGALAILARPSVLAAQKAVDTEEEE